MKLISILLIIIYYAYSSGDPYNKVKIDKRPIGNGKSTLTLILK